jgi:hypothetical protein
MGFNRRKLKDQRRNAAEKESANRRVRIAAIASSASEKEAEPAARSEAKAPACSKTAA